VKAVSDVFGFRVRGAVEVGVELARGMNVRRVEEVEVER